MHLLAMVHTLHMHVYTHLILHVYVCVCNYAFIKGCAHVIFNLPHTLSREILAKVCV